MCPALLEKYGFQASLLAFESPRLHWAGWMPESWWLCPQRLARKKQGQVVAMSTGALLCGGVPADRRTPTE